jgi:hypothetical protein
MYEYLVLKYLYCIENEMHNAASVKVATALLFSKSDFKSFKSHVTLTTYTLKCRKFFGAITCHNLGVGKLSRDETILKGQ